MSDIDKCKRVTEAARELAAAFSDVDEEGAFAPTIRWLRDTADDFEQAARDIERQHQAELEF